MIEIPKQGIAFFASDLHLSKETPKTLKAFENWLASVAQTGALIFLLGDIFEVWFGDDYSDEITQRVALAAQHARAAGAKVYFMHGNRDFLLGETFAETSGFEILPDPEFLLVNRQVILISHGDLFCTDDKVYQQFRQQTRNEKWQHDLLATPLKKRMALAQSMRNESKTHKTNSSMKIMDVNLQTVAQTFKGHWPDGYYVGKSNVIVHGHTHKCAVHPELNTPAPKVQASMKGSLTDGLRVVLPDWNFDHVIKNQPKGGFLTLEVNGDYALSLFH